MKQGFPEIGEAAIGEYPLRVTSDWIVHWLAEIEGRDDPFEGPLPRHVMRFGEYELKAVPVSELLAEGYPYSPTLAQDYAQMDPDTRPPCIFDPIDREIMDGNHRAQSARIRGEETVKTYVGIEATADPDWRSEWS